MSQSTWKRHLLDFSGSSVASIVATVADAALYALLVHTLVNWDVTSLGVAAAVGAMLGGVIHYTMCRFWVFRRFEAPLLRSAVTYFAMSWMAAIGHGFLTDWLAGLFGAAIAWTISKGAFWVIWTYPMSRYVVFYDDDEE